MGVFEHMPYSNFHDLNLDWIIEMMQETKAFLDSLPDDIIGEINKIPEIEQKIVLLTQRVANLEQFKADFLAGNLIDIEIESLSSWIDENLQDLVARIVKFVHFGLGDDGRFKAYIPETWQFLEFDSVADTDDEDFGKLILEWEEV